MKQNTKQIENADTKNLGEHIRKIRKNKKLTQTDVANALGISRSLYARIENGLSFPGYYIGDMVSVLGKEIADYYDYDINYYTNHRLLIYILLFDVSFSEVAKTFKLNKNQIRKMVFAKRKKYILQYKNEIEKLFPEMYGIQEYGEIEIIGNNSISIKVDDKYYIYPNVAGKRKERDTVCSLMASASVSAQSVQLDLSKVKIEPLFEDMVDFDTFAKSDFRVVKIEACEAVPKSKKLLKFTLNDGTDRKRTILSGIHEYYEPEELVGKTCVAITNLPTRMMMGIPSEGMLISAVYEYDGREGLNLLMLDDVIPAGAKLY